MKKAILRPIVLIAHNLRSCHNVGSLLRTADGLGIDHVWLTGYTPYPKMTTDKRLPHIAEKLHKQISKTALGAESSAMWSQTEDIFALLTRLRQGGYTLLALEQTANSISLPELRIPEKTVLIVGREVEGIEDGVVKSCDKTIEIPMFGHKESFNVVQAAAMALYQCRFG